MKCVVFETINRNRSTENILCGDINRDDDVEQQQFCTFEASSRCTVVTCGPSSVRIIMIVVIIIIIIIIIIKMHLSYSQ